MISKQIILLCLIWTTAQACENPALNNGTNTNSTDKTTEISRQKRQVICGPSSCNYCGGTLEFIPNIQGRRKIFE